MSSLVVDTVTADFIVCNSGSCTGNFTSNSLTANAATIIGAFVAGSVDAGSAAFSGNVSASSLTANTVGVAGALTAGSISANSAAIAGALTAGSIDANSGAFTTSLTLNSEAVLTESYFPPTRFYVSNKPTKITNMPSALNLFGDSPLYVQKADLGQAEEVRFLVTQTAAGSSNARMRANYSTGFGTTAEDYSGVLSTAGPNGGVEIDISSGNVVHDSGWLAINPAAKATVYLGVVISGGNGSADPEFGQIVVEFR